MTLRRSRLLCATVVAPNESERHERLQRVRIGVTGLAAVLLVVLSAGALTRSASDEPPISASPNSATLPDLVGNDSAEAPDEPLAELGVAPGKDENSANAP